MDLRLLACQLAREGFLITFGPRRDGVRPWVARRGKVVIHADPGQEPRLEITPLRVPI